MEASKSQATVGQSTKVPTRWMVNAGRFAGAIGAALLVSSPLTFWLTGDTGPVFAKMSFGVLLVVAYAATNRDIFSRLAGSRSSGLLALSFLSTLLVLGAVGLLNYVAYKYPKEFDVTREGIHTLSQQTQEVVQRLSQDVKVLAFYSPSESSYGRVVEKLERYQRLGERFHYDMVDPQSSPTLAEKYSITKSGARIVVVAGERDARVQELSEEQLTNAIISVADPSPARVYFLQGHGEPDIEDGDAAEGFQMLADAIRAEGYGVETLSLLGQASENIERRAALAQPGDAHDEEAPTLKIPDDASVLLIAGPRTKLFAPEVAAVESFLDRGGRVLLLLDPDVDAGLDEMLAHYSLELHKDIVVDLNPLARAMGFGAAAPIIQRTEPRHAITKDLKMAAILVTARSLGILDDSPSEALATPLMVTGESAWGETAPDDGVAEFDDNDHPGPVLVAAVSTKPVKHELAHIAKEHGAKKESRLVVFGDADWVSNSMFHQVGNSDLFLNTINWLAGEEKRITVRPNTRAASQLTLSGEQMGRLAFFSIDILPVLVIAMGLGVVLMRRQR